MIEKCRWTFWAHDVESRNLVVSCIRDQILEIAELQASQKDDHVSVKIEITSAKRKGPDAEQA